MKKPLIVLSLVAAWLLLGYGCDSFKKDKNGTTPVETVQVDDKDIAFEVFRRIPKEDLSEPFRTKDYTCPEDCHRHFGDSDGNDSNAEAYLEGGSNAFTVDCYPLKSGGWLAMLVNEGCFDGCEQTVKTYVYKDGLLNFANGMLPRPAMEELVDFPFLLYGISDDEIDELKSEWDQRLLYYAQGDDTLHVAVETLNYDEQFETALSSKTYVWDGESFAPIENGAKRLYQLVDFNGLGGLHLNDSMPDELPGLYKRMEGEAVAFSRDGAPFIKLHPDGAGRIQAIDVFAKELVYYRGKIGDTLNRLLYTGGAENKAYYQDGEFVVNEVTEYTDNRIDYVGPKDAMKGTFMEGPIENPKFKSDATVQYIRIYKPHLWENDTCDMRALREALDDAALDQGVPTYGINDFQYYREYYNDSCQGWCDDYRYSLHCYPLKSGGFKVYDTGLWQSGWDNENDPYSGYSRIMAYIYKNGVLTEAEVEPELNDFELKEDMFHFANVTEIEFDDFAIRIHFKDANDVLRYCEFGWDGTTMTKTINGYTEF